MAVHSTCWEFQGKWEGFKTKNKVSCIVNREDIQKGLRKFRTEAKDGLAMTDAQIEAMLKMGTLIEVI
jgi:hypothetical protein